MATSGEISQETEVFSRSSLHTFSQSSTAHNELIVGSSSFILTDMKDAAERITNVFTPSPNIAIVTTSSHKTSLYNLLSKKKGEQTYRARGFLAHADFDALMWQNQISLKKPQKNIQLSYPGSLSCTWNKPTNQTQTNKQPLKPTNQPTNQPTKPHCRNFFRLDTP